MRPRRRVGTCQDMVSKKDLHAELETVRISKNPTMVMTANGEVLAKEEATDNVRELELLVTVMLLGNTPAVLSLGKLCEEFGYSYQWTKWPETTTHQERQEISLRHTKSCTIRRTWFIDEFLYLINFSKETVTDTEIPATRRSVKASEDSSARGNSWHESTENENPNKKDDEELQSGELRGVPDWLQEFKDGLVDESVPEHRHASSSSHESPVEPRAKVVPCDHNIFTHFPTDRNWDICVRTNISRASCKRRTGTVVPRAEIFGALMTADHKVLSERCQSRHNHRFSVVLQDLATQETQKSLWSQPGNPKSFTLTIPQNLARPVKIYPGIVARELRTDRKQMGLLKEQYTEIRKLHLQYCCDQVWMKNGGRIPWNVTAICETFKISCLMGRHPVGGGSEDHLTEPLSRLEQWSNITLFLQKTYRDYIKLVQKSCQVYSLDMCCPRRESGKGT